MELVTAKMKHSGGGETFIGKPAEWKRVASMRPFNLPGSDKAGREPWRSAAAVCWELGLDYESIPEKNILLKQAWQKKINSPVSTSVGRLFDAAAALTGVCDLASFEGQGPMMFEAVCEKTSDYLKLELIQSNNLLETNWQPLVNAMLDSSLSISKRASLFHTSLAQVILQQAKSIRKNYNINRVSFSGGVFQNRLLTEYAMSLLSENNFQIHMPELIPVNDAGICFGQVINYAYTNNKVID